VRHAAALNLLRERVADRAAPHGPSLRSVRGRRTMPR
jgi:hypothetical protein